MAGFNFDSLNGLGQCHRCSRIEFKLVISYLVILEIFAKLLSIIKTCQSFYFVGIHCLGSVHYKQDSTAFAVCGAHTKMCLLYTSQVPKGRPAAVGKKTSTATAPKKQVQSQASQVTGKYY